MPSSKKWFVVINPTSGNGKAKKLWPKIKALLQSNNFDIKYQFTESGEHNVKVIYLAVNQGFKNIICIGGDGTIHNTVNGIMSQESVASSSINVGVIPIGTGNDWVKTYSIPRNIEKAISIIKKGNVITQDIGKIILMDSQTPPIYFNNLTGIGFDGYVVSRLGKLKHFGALSYLIGAIMGLLSFKNFNVTVYINSKKIKIKSLMVLVGLCKYSGGGMQLTEAFKPNDGFFDVSLAGNFNKFDIIKNILKLFNGNVVKFKKVQTFKTSNITILCDDKTEKPFIQSDGELIGNGSFKVSIIPKAFSFYV